MSRRILVPRRMGRRSPGRRRRLRTRRVEARPSQRGPTLGSALTPTFMAAVVVWLGERVTVVSPPGRRGCHDVMRYLPGGRLANDTDAPAWVRATHRVGAA